MRRSFHLRLTDTEYKFLYQRAARAEQSMATVMRWLIRGAMQRQATNAPASANDLPRHNTAGHSLVDPTTQGIVNRRS